MPDSAEQAGRFNQWLVGWWSPVQCPVYWPEPGKVDLVMMKDLFFWMASRALLPAWTSSSPADEER